MEINNFHLKRALMKPHIDIRNFLFVMAQSRPIVNSKNIAISRLLKMTLSIIINMQRLIDAASHLAANG